AGGGRPAGGSWGRQWAGPVEGASGGGQWRGEACAARRACAPSIGPRQAQHVLGDIGKHHVGGNGRGLIEPALAPLALNPVFARIAEAAKGLQAGLRRL